MNDNISSSIAGLNESAKQYLQARLDLLKLQILKKASLIASHIFGLLIVILLSTIILAFTCAAFILWYGSTYNSYLEGISIILGILFFILIVSLIFKKKLLTSLFVSRFSEILFEDNEINIK